ncbi:hypothetical protein [Desulfonatronovibrio hydrogenovorans]|uniref:hypothetical protein n=1 Tax=Desulfonatronovibrio hydrogenovorans TaxID=53245 RepID=UPI0004900B1E|nr:hypothetical protein [Desulfonatronovibrio hydrogenovorans]
MSTIMPEDKNARRAVKWIGEELLDGRDLDGLLAQAGMRFNLSPKEEQFVRKFFKDPDNIPKSE